MFWKRICGIVEIEDDISNEGFMGFPRLGFGISVMGLGIALNHCSIYFYKYLICGVIEEQAASAILGVGAENH